MGPNAAGRRRHRLAVFVVTALAAACSGGDDAAPTTTLPVTAAPTTPAPTTVPSTTLPPTTTPPPTTQPPTTAPVTTSAPVAPATSVLISQLETVLPSLLNGFVDAVNAAFRDPANPGLRAALSEHASGDLVEQVNEVLDQYVLDGRAFRESPTDPARVESQPETIGVAAGGTSAGMDACVYDTDVLVQIAPDGTETVVDATTDADLILYSFDLVGGRWYVSGFDVSAGEGACT